MTNTTVNIAAGGNDGEVKMDIESDHTWCRDAGDMVIEVK